IVPFGSNESGGVSGLAEFEPRDPTSNLHGAVLLGVKELNESLKHEKLPLRFGKLVVITAGGDRAARHTRDEVTQALGDEKNSLVEVFAIGYGPEAAKANLSEVGRAGTKVASPDLAFDAAVAKTAVAIEAQWKRYYLVSYCTPARNGSHDVR